MSDVATYEVRRSEIEIYFDRTAAEAWKRLTSDVPLGRIRASVRAGRDAMRASLLAMLPEDLSGCRVLDAGCGTGALAIALAKRGARVVAVDLSPTLIQHARELAVAAGVDGAIDFASGDMLAADHGRFDHVVLMDSLIHYEPADAAAALASLSARCDRSIVFTVVPKTALLAGMHRIGRLFPRGDRAPAIVPVAIGGFCARLDVHPSLAGWSIGAERRIASGFYKSHGMELVRS
ncbi:magnesium protoporphyrin IX methyltransferase [Jiella sp. MQZ9-1]|uniref:Magnesium protoporphyrin IX methyltransferase n=1 Tax=Jiella flava TaxID=2816857 RepID=A0A939FYZ9_9HYPH|nr:magnesium protoporphyrin IX methyltransferase [Jiella flava]MBO0663316.1 magnesium protoporphyrin IX methyltransferase [Jiella flava]MCD2471892.1 magnesium protoporphyrin IX methyltransferase [Jiella flava]